MDLSFFEVYLNKIKGESARKDVFMICKKLVDFMEEEDIDDISCFSQMIMDMFIKKEYKGKSDTAIALFVIRIKDIFKYFNNYEAVEHLSLSYINFITGAYDFKYFSPSSILDLIESLLNYQEKALVLLIYLGLYDDNMSLIRSLKSEDLGNHVLHLKDREDIKLNEFCYNILKEATKEEEVKKYVTCDVSTVPSLSYKLDMKSPYLIKARRKKEEEEPKPVSVSVIKSKFARFSKYLDKKITPISIKNSRTLYEFALLEHEANKKLNINNRVNSNSKLKAKKDETLEDINLVKNKVKLETLRDIENGRDWFIK